MARASNDVGDSRFFLTILVSRTRYIDSKYKDIHLHMIILTFLIGRSRYIDSKIKSHIYMEIVCKDLNTREKKTTYLFLKPVPVVGFL
jgi:hypothetical protein